MIYKLSYRSENQPSEKIMTCFDQFNVEYKRLLSYEIDMGHTILIKEDVCSFWTLQENMYQMDL